MIYCDDSRYFADMARRCGRAAVLNLTLALVLLTGACYLYALGSGWAVHAGALAIFAAGLAVANMGRAWRFAGLAIRWRGYEIQRDLNLNRGPIRFE